MGTLRLDRTFLSILGIALIALFATACGDDAPDDPSAAQPRDRGAPPLDSLVIGSISNTPSEEYSIFRPLADYLAQHLGDVGVVRGGVKVAHGLSEMAEMLKSGEVDLFIDSPFPTAWMSRVAGSIPFLRRWKDGQEKYHSVLFVRADSGIDSLDDLAGRTVAFDTKYSTSAYLLPKASLLQAGYTLEAAKHDGPPPPDRIGYCFSEDDETTVMWVLEGKVAAGAVPHHDLEELAGVRNRELRVLHRSIDVPRHVVSHRGDLDPDIVAAVEKALFEMEATNEGRRVLLEFEMTTKFDHFPEGAPAAFRPIEELLDEVAQEIGP